MSIKDNFYQAVKEMLNTGGLVGTDLEEKSREEKSELDAYLEATPPATPAAPPVPEPPVYSRAPSPAPTQPSYSFGSQQEAEVPAWEAPSSAASYAAPAYEGPRASSSYGASRQDAPPPTPPSPPYRPVDPLDSPPYEPAPEMTVISKNTLVDGNIRSFASISIDGNVRGDVNVVKDAYISGKMIGELKYNNVAMQGSSVQGDVVSKGQVIIDSNSLLLGNMSAQYAHIDGKVKGNMEVSGKVEFKSDAVVIGDVKTSSLTVMDGANIQGFINTTYLLENPDRFFPGQVSIDEAEMAR